jgi:hypothetical protein
VQLTLRTSGRTEQHVSTIERTHRGAYLLKKTLDLPCAYGDGTPIPREYLDKLVEIIDEEEVYLRLEDGDFLLVDNFQVSHGRQPWVGERLVLVSLWEGAHTLAAY